MSQKHRTKDEIYILCLHEEAQKSGDLQRPFDRYDIGKLARVHPKAVDTICKLLLQANFIKKASEVDIYLTQNGVNLILRLLNE